MKTSSRLTSVDALRGLVMVLMMLDHVRHFFSGAGINPEDLAKTTPELFFTRWITHYCAPTFMLLAGLGAGLAEDRGMSKCQLAVFLLTRGLWLIWLEFTIVRLGFFFSFDAKEFHGLVIWALGASMVLLAGLQFLPRYAVLFFGLLLCSYHDALRPIQPNGEDANWLWTLLHVHGQIKLGNTTFHFPYKIVPWVGVMALGYAMTPLFRLDTGRRRMWLTVLGIACCLGFVALRYSNIYGDPDPWKPQESPMFTVMSFLKCEKYPPSLCYLLMTLGPALVALAWFDWAPEWLCVFGRVPLFYYLLHLPLIHALAVLVSWWQDGRVAAFLLAAPRDSEPPPGYGYELPVIYGIWVLCVAILYPLCLWYAGVKRRDQTGWLSYL